VNDTNTRLWHPWLRINRVLRVMLHTRWRGGGVVSGQDRVQASVDPQLTNAASSSTHAANSSGLLDSRQPSSTEVLMRRIGLTVAFAISLNAAIQARSRGVAHLSGVPRSARITAMR
jgi:hypothetical protein